MLGDYISSDPRPYGQMLFVALVKGNWDDLMKKFCEWFFPLSKVQHIRKQVINFVQGEEEGIDQAWDRFNGLIEQGPELGFSSDVL